ncbi:MAG: hypothetical protein JWR40_4697 [Massilia sp.]|jgi:hypothetical protein|nr:hypothetical protein [Massilia sp.]MDB5951524.1 hypothetical protein [Massilia sp.]
MGEVYRRALVLQFAERMLALGCRFDDDGEIDVFRFGAQVHQPAPMGIGAGGDYFKRAIEAVCRFYFPDGGPALRQSYGADQGQGLPS